MGRSTSTDHASVKAYGSPKVGFQAALRRTPTCIKSDAAGSCCGCYGCDVFGNAPYSNPLEFVGGLAIRFQVVVAG